MRVTGLAGLRQSSKILLMYGRYTGAMVRYRKSKPSDGSFVAQVIGLSVFVSAVTWQVAPRVEDALSQVGKTSAEIAAIERSVYYSGCDEARAAGAAPLFRGQPGYRDGMDGDSDGIACEPYRGR